MKIPVLPNLNIVVSYPFAKLFCIVLAILLLGQYGAALLILAGIVLTLKDSDKGIQALTVSFMIAFVNPLLFNSPLSSIVSFLRIVLLLSFFIRVFFLNKTDIKIGSYIKSIFVFLYIAAFITVIASYNIGVSISKLVQFGIGAGSILVAFSHTKKSKEYWLSWFYTLFVVFLLLSVPTYFIKGIGFALNGDGFQGITNHPQAFAIFLAPFLSYLLLKLAFSRYGNPKQYFYFTAIALVMMFLTKGRTGVTAMVVAFLIAYIYHVSSREYSLKILLSKLSTKGNAFLLLCIAFVLVLNLNAVSGVITSFVLKREQAVDLETAVTASRGKLFEEQTANILEKPFFGIGFGLPSNYNIWYVQRDPIFNLPLSAPVEKGFLFYAVIEELGIIGSFFFYISILILLGHILKSNTLPVAGMALTAFFTNVGETTLFSFGGLGLLVWLLIGVATIKENT